MHEYESLTEGEAWLKRYTYDNVGICPGDDVVRELLSRHPYEGGTLYRGLNFLGKEAFDGFMEATSNGTVLESHAVTSWAKEEAGARQFAVTRPSYHLDSITKDAQAEKNANRDHMIGHAGVILKITLPPDVAIDVTKSRYDKEGEVILPAGTYRIELHEVLRPFMQTITAETYNKDLLQISSLKSSQADRARFNHIVNRFQDYSDDTRAHIFNLIAEDFQKVEIDANRSDPTDNGRRINKKMVEFYLGWNFPGELLDHYDKFLPEHRARVDGLLAEATATIDREFLKIAADMDWKREPFVLLIDHSLREAIDSGRITPEFPATINAGVGQYYRHMNSPAVTSTITQDDLSTHAKQIHHALEQMMRTPKAEELRRARAAMQAAQAQEGVKTLSPA